MKIHIIHDLKVGGVESAVYKYCLSNDVDENYHVFAIGSNRGVDITSISGRFTFFNAKWYHFWVYFIIAFLAVKKEPRIVVTSLWRSHFVGILIRLISRKTKLVCFIHNSKFVHFFDGFITYLFVNVCDSVLADSNSAKEFIKKYIHSSIDNVSIIELIFPIDSQALNKPFIKRYTNRVVFLGRITKQKNLQRSIRFIHELHRSGLHVHYDIFGEDEGLKEDLVYLSSKLGIEDYVHFKGPVSFLEVPSLLADYRFMLQLSLFEGFGMSVVESLQSGTIPITTPVGESISYCSDNINAIIIEDDFSVAIENIIKMSDDDIFNMSSSAKNTFLSVKYFPISFSRYMSSIERL